MRDMWTVLVPILLADVVNPVLFGFIVYAAGTKSPVVTSSAALLGHTLAYFSVGLVLAPGIEFLSDRLANPHRIDFIISLIVGLLLVWAAIVSFRNKDAQKTEYVNLSPVKAFGLGAIINFVGIPFALPYFAALGQILKADFSTVDSVLALLGYNLLYALPFMTVPFLVIVMGGASRSLLKEINTRVESVGNYLMPVILGLMGLALVLDAVLFFMTRKGLF